MAEGTDPSALSLQPLAFSSVWTRRYRGPRPLRLMLDRQVLNFGDQLLQLVPFDHFLLQ
jgi:hypothetical protein